MCSAHQLQATGALHRAVATAQDAVKFLTTLERHFKNLEHAPLPAVTEMLPSMVSAIQMVWVISRT